MDNMSVNNQRPFYIGVVGGGVCNQREELVAEEVGKKIAQRGMILICGGLGGAMNAACRGAYKAGGASIGILPGNQKEGGNPYLTYTIATGLEEARNTIIVHTCDVLIAVSGEYGTLSEIAFALKTGKPVIGIDTWELYKNGQRMSNIIYVNTAEQAVNQAEIALRKTPK